MSDIEEALTSCGASALIQKRITPFLDSIPRVDFNYGTIEYNMEEKMNDSDLREIALENAERWAGAFNRSSDSTYVDDASVIEAAHLFYDFLTAGAPEYDDQAAWEKGFDAGFELGYDECTFDNEDQASDEGESDPIEVMAEALEKWASDLVSDLKKRLPKVKVF